MREREIFDAALAIADPAERAGYLEQACAGDTALAAHLAGLLDMHGQLGSFLEAPASAVAATVGTSAIPDEAGTIIGKYKLLEPIGEGGMGTVWMAQQTEPVKRVVALKLIKAGMDSKQVIVRFEAERQALALMDHPNIAKVFDGGMTSEPDAPARAALAGASGSGRPYFVMELVKGQPITKYCDERHLTPRQRLELFIPVCQAVQHAHQKGIIHRDLKPANVLVALYDSKPVPKVIDFGVAKATGQPLTEQTLVTGFGNIVGTLEYMSPEQAEINQLDIDTRSDIYSLGVVLYELLTGSPPFSRKDLETVGVLETLRLIREQEPPKPSTRLSTAEGLPTLAANRGTEPAKLTKLVRGELDWIVMKALEKDRDRRYQTANAFVMDVERYLADEPVEACPPSVGYRLRKFARKHRKLLSTAAAFVVLLTVAAGVSIWLAVRAGIAERATRDERDKVVAEKERGDEEAAIADAVNDFLQRDLLGQADIANQPAGLVRNNDLTVRELLDRAARGIDARFRGQEKTEAAIRDTLGMAYRGLGEYALAQTHLQRAVALRREKLGARHRRTLESMNNLASVWWENGEHDKAETVYNEVLAGLSAQLGSDHPDLLMVVSNLAMLDQARTRYDDAERRYKEVIDGFRAVYGPDHEKTLHSMGNLAALYDARGRRQEAVRLQEQVVAGYRRLFDAKHPKTLFRINNLATAYLQSKRYGDAERLFDEVLKARRDTLPDGHPDTLATMNDLAVVYQEQGLHEKAEPMFREALKASTAKPGPHHPLTLKIKNCLATLCDQRGYREEAEALFREVLASRRAKLEAEHPETLTSAHNLGVHYSRRGLYEKAEPLLVEAAAGGRAKLTIKHPDTQNWINSLAVLYGRQDKPQLAEPLRRELMTFFRESAGPESDAYLLQLGLLSQNLEQQKKYAEAEPLCREWVAAFDNMEPNVWTTYAGRAALGAVLLGQKKYAEAEKQLLAGYEGMKAREATIPKQGRFRLIRSLEWLVQLYDAWAKPAEAARWRKELADATARGK